MLCRETFSSDQTPNAESMNSAFLSFFQLQIGFIDENKQLNQNICPFWFSNKKGLGVDHNSKFCEQKSGFVGSGLGIWYDEQVMNMSNKHVQFLPRVVNSEETYFKTRFYLENT